MVKRRGLRFYCVDYRRVLENIQSTIDLHDGTVVCDVAVAVAVAAAAAAT